jgi:WD40 repeat protein/DNA-directed RNA polymerase specialized sigma24 family protein
MPPRSAVLLSRLCRLTPVPADAELLRRWVERRDEDAFAALVSRHGRMVLGVCRRVLSRKAAALRHPEALPGWLHGVAVRLACKARHAASRRPCGVSDPSASEPRDPHPDPLDALSARELLVLIDQEIARLPEVYRLPLVLCDLEDRTQNEAARLLGWTFGSVRGRLLRGRERLRSRLAQRGIAPAVLAAAMVQGRVDAALTASVSRLAVRYSAHPTSAEVSPSVAALVHEGIQGVVLAKLKLVSAVLLIASTLVAGAGLVAWSVPTPQPAEEREETKPTATPVSEKPQVQRDRAGDPLPADALSRLGTTRFRQGAIIDHLAFGPGGKTLASCGRDGLRFWDAADGKEIHPFAVPPHAQGIAVSPDGQRLDKLQDSTIDILDFATGRLLGHIGEKTTPSNHLFSPDGKILAEFCWQRDIELWDAVGGRLLHTLKGHKESVWSVAFSADGKTLVSCGDDMTIRFWDVAAGKELRQIAHGNRIGLVALSPDGKLLASVDTIKHSAQNVTYWLNDFRVHLWDVATGKELRQLAMPPRQLPSKYPVGFRALTFSPDGKMLLTGGLDGILRIWNPSTGQEVRQIAGFCGSPTCFSYAADGKTLAVVDGSTTIRLLDSSSGKDVVPSRGHRGGISSISVTPDGQTAATTSHDGTLRIWDPATGRELDRRAMTADSFRFLQLQPDGRTYVATGADRVYRLHDLGTRNELAVLRGHEAYFPFTLSPDRKTLASMNADKTVRLLDPATGEIRHTLTRVKRRVSGMSVSVHWSMVTNEQYGIEAPRPTLALSQLGL